MVPGNGRFPSFQFMNSFWFDCCGLEVFFVVESWHDCGDDVAVVLDLEEDVVAVAEDGWPVDIAIEE